MKQEILFGIHVIKTKIDLYPDSIKIIYFLNDKKRNDRIKELLLLARKKNINLSFVNSVKFLQLCNTSSVSTNKNIVHQGVAACCDSFKIYTEFNLPDILSKINTPNLILILDMIQDSHNLGACIRSAAALGVNFIIFSKDNTVRVNASVQKVASGCIEKVTLISVVNIIRVIQFLQKHGVWIVGLDCDSKKNLFSCDLRDSVALVLGRESLGLRNIVKNSCDYLVSLPMHNGVSSLNLSVAAGIAMYEVVRQRNNFK